MEALLLLFLTSPVDGATVLHPSPLQRVSYEAQWTPESVWLLRRKKPTAPTGNSVLFLRLYSQYCNQYSDHAYIHTYSCVCIGQ
jgi:hypothetical protein